MGWRKRLEMAVTRWLFGLSPRTLVRLSGKPKVVVDGLTLHPEIQFLLAARDLRGEGSIKDASPERARRKVRHEADRYPDPPLPLAAVKDLTLQTDVGPLSARHYSPDEPGGPHPLVVFFHGGGFVVGDLETHDGFCRQLCHHAGVHVLSVVYRLAPEHPFPSGLDDARAAFLWAKAHAAELGADPKRVGVGGDSAGGNLSAVVTQQLSGARDAQFGGAKAPAFQLLIYPATDRRTARPSATLFADGFFLTGADMAWFDHAYIGTREELRSDPRVSPLLAPDLSGLPPAYLLTAGFDPLRDEGEAYAAALASANNRVTHRRFDGMIHGFINMTSVSPASRAGVLEIARETRRLARS